MELVVLLILIIVLYIINNYKLNEFVLKGEPNLGTKRLVPFFCPNFAKQKLALSEAAKALRYYGEGRAKGKVVVTLKNETRRTK